MDREGEGEWERKRGRGRRERLREREGGRDQKALSMSKSWFEIISWYFDEHYSRYDKSWCYLYTIWWMFDIGKNQDPGWDQNLDTLFCVCSIATLTLLLSYSWIVIVILHWSMLATNVIIPFCTQMVLHLIFLWCHQLLYWISIHYHLVPKGNKTKISILASTYQSHLRHHNYVLVGTLKAHWFL